MVWPIMDESLRSRWHAALQLIEPVQHDVELRDRGSLPGRLHHQETLTIGANVVVGRNPAGRLVRSLKKDPCDGRLERRLRGDIHCHHLVAAAVKKLPSISRPAGLPTAFGRN